MVPKAGSIWLWLAACCLAGASGCIRPSAAPVARVEQAVTDAVTPVVLSDGRAANGEETATTAAIIEPAAGEEKPIEQSEPAAQTESKERILLMAPDGPLIIDFVLTIDGRPH